MTEFFIIAGTSIVAWCAFWVPMLILDNRRKRRLDDTAEELFDERCRLTAMAALLGENVELLGNMQSQTFAVTPGDTINMVGKDGRYIFKVTSSHATTLKVEC